MIPIHQLHDTKKMKADTLYKLAKEAYEEFGLMTGESAGSILIDPIDAPEDIPSINFQYDRRGEPEIVTIRGFGTTMHIKDREPIFVDGTDPENEHERLYTTSIAGTCRVLEDRCRRETGVSIANYEYEVNYPKSYDLDEHAQGLKDAGESGAIALTSLLSYSRSGRREDA